MSFDAFWRFSRTFGMFVMVFLCALILVAAMPGTSAGANRFVAVTYHDITPKPVAPEDLTPEELMKQFRLFQSSGLHPVSPADIAAAAAGKKTLPEKAILLTFDDGYLSFYKIVYPALKAFKYPAVLSVVSSWTDGRSNPDALYNDKGFMNWDQIKEVAKSGLVTIASHSDSLHTYVHSNPDGNIEPASSTFVFDRVSGIYETDEQYRKRIRSDMETSIAVFQKKLGVKPTVYTWPYGAYTGLGVEEGIKAGFSMFLTLGSSPVDIGRTRTISRYHAQNMRDWLPLLTRPSKDTGDGATQIRAVQIDLDKIINPESYKESDTKLGKCLERLSSLGVNTVFVQAFNDSQGTGNVSSLYFQNSVLPVDMDFLSHTVNRIKARGMQAFVWMPALAFELPNPDRNEALWVREMKNGTVRIADSSYKRFSPFDEGSLAITRAMFRDLAANVDFDGILFQDDAYLTDNEDYHPAAAAAFRKAFGTSLSPAALANAAVKMKWNAMKTAALDNYLSALTDTIKTYRPLAKTARNIYSTVVMNPASEEYFSQNLGSFLKNYDYTVIMAYTQMEKVGTRKDTRKWLRAMFERVKKENGTNKTIFKVQAYDWKKKDWVTESALKDELSYLLALGARHVGYYPDGVIEDRPRSGAIASVVSGQEHVRGIRGH